MGSIRTHTHITHNFRRLIAEVSGRLLLEIHSRVMLPL